MEELKSSTVTVAELSSFQLELIEKFRPDIALFLNLTPDHLDRHKTMEAYAGAKARIFENQTELDAAVLNADDPADRALRPEKAASFLVQPQAARGSRARACAATTSSSCATRKEEFVLQARGDSPAGAHNVENVLAA